MNTTKKVISYASLLLVLLQVVFFLLVEPWPSIYLIATLGFSLISLGCFVLLSRSQRPLWFYLGIQVGCVQFAMYLFHLFASSPPYPLRLLQVTILVLFFTTLLAALLAGARLIKTEGAFLLMYVSGLSFIGIEVFSGFLPFPAIQNPEWRGQVLMDESLGMRYKPYSELRTYYPDNPRKYFWEEQEAHTSRMIVAPGNEASLLSDLDRKGWRRVEIAKSQTAEPWDIQLNISGYLIQAGTRYRVLLEARADAPRSAKIGLSRADGNWENLGLYGNISLTEKWQKFQFELKGLEHYKNGRIHLDVGGVNIPISMEVQNVQLVNIDTGQEVIAPTITKYYVNYKFNKLGCRGPDYDIPKSKHVKRILLLGDSNTLGCGVHEEDTLSSQLQVLLNKQFDTQYEVINGGVSGYSTKDEMLFYTKYMASYEPDIVVLVMAMNDDISWTEEKERKFHYAPGKIDQLFGTIGAMARMKLQYSRPPRDFSESVTNILNLNREVEAHGSRLLVAVHRNMPLELTNLRGYELTWGRTISTVSNGLKDTKIPFLDLGEDLLKKHDYIDLVVHSGMDLHPNEVSNRISAGTLLQFIATNHSLAK